MDAGLAKEIVLEVLESISETCKDNTYCDGLCPYYNVGEDECSFRLAPDHWHLDEIV